MKRQLKQEIDHSRQQLRKRQAADAKALDATHAQMISLLQPTLDHLSRQMEAKQRAGEKVNLSWLYEGGKLQGLKQGVDHAVNHFGALARMVVENSLSWASRLGSQAAHLFMRTVEPGQQFRAADQGAISGVLNRFMGQIGQLFGGFGAEAAKEVGAALIRGVSLGSSVKDISQEITKTLDISRQRALSISGTLPTQVYKEMTIAEYQANEDTIVGWVWICSLQPNSCLACVAMHGTVHKFSETFHDHPHGHCQAIPYTRNSQPVQQGANWFADQSSETQQAILGSRVAYDLYQSGKADVQDFIGFRHDPQWGVSVYQKSAKQVVKG